MGGGWTNPLQTLTQGLVLTFDVEVDPDPELDNTLHWKYTFTNTFDRFYNRYTYVQILKNDVDSTG